MNAISPTKQYRCKVCKATFTKRSAWQSLCGSIDCAVSIANKLKAKRERLDRAETRQKLADMATKPELTALAQKAFNAYVRMRDYGLKCISCNNPIAWDGEKTGGVVDCGHYLSVGARVNLRFTEDNAAAQCKKCNNFLAGNAVNYRIGLVKRIGLARVEALECDHDLKHYSKDDLRAMAAKYKQLTKELQA